MPILPRIPVPARDCESEQDKFLYNIWQQLDFGVSPIPGNIPPTAQFPLGWDVNSTTNALLYNIWLLLGGVVPPIGSVTSVGSASNSLANTSTANPITTTGNIGFELQVIPITRAALITKVATSALLPDVTYKVTDAQAPLDSMFCRAISVNQLDATMSGLIAGEFVRVGWSPFADSINEIYCPRRNNRVARRSGSTRDCIETFVATTSTYFNCEVIESDFTDGGGQLRLDGFKVEEDSVIELQGDVTIDGMKCDAGTALIAIDCSLFRWRVGQGATVVVQGTDVNTDIWDGINILTVQSLILTAPEDNKSYFPSANEVQLDTPANAGFFTVADSLATNIFICFTPAAAIASYNILLPDAPKDGQTYHMATTQTITLVNIGGNGHAVVGVPLAFVQFTQISYYYDLATDTFYLI